MAATPPRNPADQGGAAYWQQPQQATVGSNAPQTGPISGNAGAGQSPWNHAPGWGPGGSGGETPFGQPGSPYSGAGFAGMYDYSDPFSKTWGGFRY